MCYRERVSLGQIEYQKNDTAGGFLSVTNQLSTMENLQNDSKILKIERLMTDIGALTIRGGARKGYDPHIGSGGLKI